MPLFDLGPSVRIRRTFPCTLTQAVQQCHSVIHSYSGMGYDVTLHTELPTDRLGATVSNNDGTHIDVLIVLADDGALTALDIALTGHIYVGGAKGMFATEKMVRSVATDQLTKFVDAQFSGIEREAPAAEPEPEPPSEPEPEPASAAEPEPEPAHAPGYEEMAEAVEAETYETPDDQDRAVQDAITVCSVGAAAVTIQPVPLVDIALITPIQMAMVQMIGNIRGYALTPQSITELIGTFGASVVSRNIVIAAAKLIPVAGWAVSVPVAYALTYAMGKSVDMYFQSGRTVPLSEVRSMFEKVYESTKAEKEKSTRANASLKDKLQQLVDAYDAGLITEREFTDKKEELLAAL